MSDATTYSVATACVVDRAPFLMLPEASALTFPVTDALRKRLADSKEDCLLHRCAPWGVTRVPASGFWPLGQHQLFDTGVVMRCAMTCAVIFGMLSS